jgi:hypothetical protein
VRRVCAGAAVTIAGLLAAACNALTGAGGFEVGLVSADGGTLESGTPDDATKPSNDGTIGPTDAQPAMDAPSDAPTSLTCAGVGGAGVPAAPSGWSRSLTRR